MMEQLTDHHYEVLTVPEESAANCIYIKGPSKRDFLLHRPAEECPESISVSSPEEFFVRFNPADPIKALNRSSHRTKMSRFYSVGRCFPLKKHLHCLFKATVGVSGPFLTL